MIAAADFNISKVEHSKLEGISLENVPFGKYFTDHMLEADYEDGEWKTPQILPYQPLQLDPSLAALHYGQSIFEGIKTRPVIHKYLDHTIISEGLTYLQTECKCQPYRKRYS